MLSVSEPSISQQSQFTEDTVETSVLCGYFNLKVYAAFFHDLFLSPISQHSVWSEIKPYNTRLRRPLSHAAVTSRQ